MREISTLEIEKNIENKQDMLLLCISDWCYPCKIMKKQLEKLDGENICWTDLEKNKEIVEKFNLVGIPAIVILNKGLVESKYYGKKTDSFIKNISEQIETKLSIG